MMPVLAPILDVNSETGIIVSWHKQNRDEVKRGDAIVEIETSKSIIVVEAQDEGFLLQAAPEDAEVSLKAPVAHLFEDMKALEAFTKRQAEEKSEEKPYRATAKAEALAKKHGIDLEKLDQGQLITTKEVEQAIADAQPVDMSVLPELLEVEAGVERVVLFGGGLGATQVIDIYRDDPKRKAVGIVDDDRAKWGQLVYDVPVIGAVDRLGELYKQKKFDSALCAISTSVPTRTKFRKMCEKLGIPMANAIDRTSKLSSDVEIGTGNVICGFCYFGTGTKVGSGNFISAYNSYDHHNELGNDISTGPGVMTSGLVKIGNRVRMGTGIFIEPHVELGDGVVVASGAVLVQSVPAEHVVKARTGRIAIVPLRK